MSVRGSKFEWFAGLDVDQQAALQRFIADLKTVLSDADGATAHSGRMLEALAAAYRSALLTSRWELLVAVLADALDRLGPSGCESALAAYRRLRSVVRENADLLPPEMTLAAVK